MPLRTNPANVDLTTAWVEIASGVSRCAVTLEGVAKAVVCVASAKPGATSTAGHTLSQLRFGMNFEPLEGGVVYARALGAATSIAVTKG